MSKAEIMIYTFNYTSPFGNIRLTSDGNFLTGARTEFWPERADRKGLCPKGESETDGSSLPCLQQAAKWLDIYFSGNIPDFLPPLKLWGSDFQRTVWRHLQDIPYGTLTTYGKIADKIARDRRCGKMSAQAVGGAVGANPVGIIVPCHRVIGSNGSLTGYGGGLTYKVKLLELEGISCSKLKMPKKSRFL